MPPRERPGSTASGSSRSVSTDSGAPRDRWESRSGRARSSSPPSPAPTGSPAARCRHGRRLRWCSSPPRPRSSASPSAPKRRPCCFLAVELLLLDGVIRWSTVVALVGLQIVWANMHALSVLALVPLGAELGGALAARWLPLPAAWRAASARAPDEIAPTRLRRRGRRARRRDHALRARGRGISPLAADPHPGEGRALLHDHRAPGDQPGRALARGGARVRHPAGARRGRRAGVAAPLATRARRRGRGLRRARLDGTPQRRPARLRRAAAGGAAASLRRSRRRTPGSAHVGVCGRRWRSGWRLSSSRRRHAW